MFFVNVPIGIVIALLALRFIPRDRPAAGKAAASMDFAGMALLGVCLLAGMLAINTLGEKGGSAWAFAAAQAVAVLAAVLFVLRIRRAAQPFIAPHLIYGTGFGVVNLVNAIFGGMSIGVVALIPLYATNRYGIDVLAAGSLLIAQGVAAIVFSLLATWGLRRTGYRRPLYVGVLAIVVGMLATAAHPPAGVAPYPWLMGAAFLVGVGVGVVNPASRNAGLQLAPQNASTLAAMRTLFLQIGTIATVSIATAVLAVAADPGAMQAWIYAAVAGVLVLALPLVSRVPDHRGAW